MTETTTTPRLTSLSHGAGCACKLSLDELLGVLSGMGAGSHPDLLVGFRTGDDAAVWRRDDGRALVATTDFFTPIVDDPVAWGQIAAANAVSDVYAMGATPLFALNVLGWPRELSFDILRGVLSGAAEIAERAGYVIAGGHSIDSLEPMYGQAVVGEITAGQPLTNAGGRPGDVLVLTKPVGTGIVTTALKRNELHEHEADAPLAGPYRAAVASMTRLNDVAADVARQSEASAATDVTGFGLLGHGHRLALASQVALRIDAAAVPLLPGVMDLLEAGYVPGGTQRNAQQATRYLHGPVEDDVLMVLSDAQTSGGLLFASAPASAEDAVSALNEQGHESAVVGQLLDGPAGQVQVQS